MTSYDYESYAEVDAVADPPKKDKKTVVVQSAAKKPSQGAMGKIDYKLKYEQVSRELKKLKAKVKADKKKEEEKKKNALRKKTIQAKKAQLAKEQEEGCKGLVPGMNVAAPRV